MKLLYKGIVRNLVICLISSCMLTSSLFAGPFAAGLKKTTDTLSPRLQINSSNFINYFNDENFQIISKSTIKQADSIISSNKNSDGLLSFAKDKIQKLADTVYLRALPHVSLLRQAWKRAVFSTRLYAYWYYYATKGWLPTFSSGQNSNKSTALGMALSLGWTGLIVSACQGQMFQMQMQETQNTMFYNELTYYAKQVADEKEPKTVVLSRFFDKFALIEINELIEKFGIDSFRKAISRFGAEGTGKLIDSKGPDYFIMALHGMLGSADYFDYLDEIFGIDPQRLTQSAIESGSRFTGMQILLDSNVPIEDFKKMINVFSEVLPEGVFIDYFYKDPYLVATALKIMHERSPDGVLLDEFLSYFPDKEARGEFFTNDLPGLVVVFSTLHEMKTGGQLGFLYYYFDITSEDVVSLIKKDAINFAVAFFGAHKIGEEGFKQLTKVVGKDIMRTALFEHTSFLADFLTGMKKISIFSTDTDFASLSQAEAKIKSEKPFLLSYDSYKDKYYPEVIKIFSNLGSSEAFLSNPEKNHQTRIYALALLATYQRMLSQMTPELMLDNTQFELMKMQILCSTRISDLFNNAVSTLEVGAKIIKDKSMETFILILAHEMGHLLLSIQGFDAPLLSVASIHEMSADVGAKAIQAMLAEHIPYNVGLKEYHEKIAEKSNYAENKKATEEQLIASGEQHAIGRTQLGYIVKGLESMGYKIDYKTLFTSILSTLKGQAKIKFIDFVQEIIVKYIISVEGKNISDEQLIVLLNNQKQVLGTSQMANADLIKKIAEQVLSESGSILHSKTVQKQAEDLDMESLTATIFSAPSGFMPQQAMSQLINMSI